MTSPAAPPRSRRPRVLRWIAGTLAVLLLAAVAVLAGAWIWAGSQQSLGAALARAARYLPAGQTLASRDVAGSLRGGGRIGWLRWQSEALAVEVHDAHIGWSLAPLLRRQVRLGEVHVREVVIEKRGPQKESEPVEPLQGLVLPMEITLPFRIDTIRWTGPPETVATGLAGSYRYRNGRHEAEITGVDVYSGHYAARATVQGAAPMAVDAALQARVRAPAPGGAEPLPVRADAQVTGTLAGAGARLQVKATLDAEAAPAAVPAPAPAPKKTARGKPAAKPPAPPPAPAPVPMHVSLDAEVAPWNTAQPLVRALADLSGFDAARLAPTAPSTRIDGHVEAGPDGGRWLARATLHNALAGPWDQRRAPIESAEAQAVFDHGVWTIPQATVHPAGGGTLALEGRWGPAPAVPEEGTSAKAQPAVAPWQARLAVADLRPGALHTRLDGPAITGTAQATGDAAGTIAFDTDLKARGAAAPPRKQAGVLQGLGLQSASAKGRWVAAEQLLDLAALAVQTRDAKLQGKVQARVAAQSGQGQFAFSAPGARADLDGRIAPAAGSGTFDLRVDDAAALQRWAASLPGLGGLLAGAQASGTARLDARWQGGWQAAQQRLATGRAPANARDELSLTATLDTPRLDLRIPSNTGGISLEPADSSRSTPPSPPSTSIALQSVKAELAGTLARATLAVRGSAAMDTRRATLDLSASGGLAGDGLWQATLAALKLDAQDEGLPGPWRLALSRPFDARVRTGGGALLVEATAGSATLSGPAPGAVQIAWEPLRLERTAAGALRLRSQGRIDGLPMAWAQAVAAEGRDALADLGLAGDLVFDGTWDIDAGDTLRARASLVRRSGDIRVLAGDAPAAPTQLTSSGPAESKAATARTALAGQTVAAGVREARATLTAEGDAVRAELAWDSERAGSLQAQGSTRVRQADGGWQWPADAPLAARVRARLPNVGLWSVLAPPGWRIEGSLDADATLSGSRAAPRWSGTLAGDRLAVRSVVDGIELRDGRLRAALAGDRLDITEFTLHGGTGPATRIPGIAGTRATASQLGAAGGGTLAARGSVAWNQPATDGGSGLRMDIAATLDALRVSVRTDRQLTLSGRLDSTLEASGRLKLRGDLKADRAAIILPDDTAPTLGKDVVVHSAALDREAARKARKAEAAAARPGTRKPPDIVVGFDLGDDFAVQGRGITTRLAGKVEVRSTAGLDQPPRLTGEIRTVAGRYRAYSQQLDVESGLIRFNGPLDNPSLDILALRPNISVRAGVRVTGTAQSPSVKLYSESSLTDAEILSWVVLGRSTANGGAEAALLQQAALAFLSGGKGPGGAGIANRLGLDEIGFKGPTSATGTTAAEAAALTFGKRLSQNLYVTYERSLSGTLGALYIFYDLSRRLTLRGQTGVKSAVDLIYTLAYD
ncbi:translocation/assembly module TamB domain-containing protein [Xylophilus sp.]|uniref:translocation/assembly module TamB domain-containing protein n=1 Tax=Xylophilus sp. TaxID=2653893 RepID=UPI0013B99006|nr:translocation/assembly module TamB domain-containing protein [Xylophilus sp.]KAF1048539.1 MAG: Translocation and assembly module subunit TamB [Xylophilus sp.]